MCVCVCVFFLIDCFLFLGRHMEDIWEESWRGIFDGFVEATNRNAQDGPVHAVGTKSPLTVVSLKVAYSSALPSIYRQDTMERLLPSRSRSWLADLIDVMNEALARSRRKNWKYVPKV